MENFMFLLIIKISQNWLNNHMEHKICNLCELPTD